MSSKNWLAAISAAFIMAGLAQAAPPLEAFGRLPSTSHMTMSPNGDLIAFAKETPAQRIIIVYSFSAKKPIAMIRQADQKLRDLEWADDRHLLITASTTAVPRKFWGKRGEYSMAQSYDVQTNKSLMMLDHVAVTGDANIETMNVIAGPPQPRVIDGKTYVFVAGYYYVSQIGRLGLFRIDLDSGEAKLVAGRFSTNAQDWLVDAAGTVVAEASYDEMAERWKAMVYRNGVASPGVEVPASSEWPSLEGLSEDGSGIVVRLPGTENGEVYQQIALSNGAKTIWHNGETNFSGLVVDARTGRIAGGVRSSDREEYDFVDPQLQTMWNSIKGAFKTATDVKVVSWSADKKKAVLKVFGPEFGNVYYVLDLNTHKADPLGPIYDGIEDVAEVKWIDYKAADGRKIPAYLTLPPGRDPKNLPLIVLPHGGPHARDYPGFDWWSQALAARGYVVLQPQFRGSGGFGKEWLEAGFGEFGKKMQTDLSDGVRALAAQGLIDPKRVCIVGASYGGYAALAGATLDTGVYRCAVSVAGLSDLKAQLNNWHWPLNRTDARGERIWGRYLNIEDPSDPKLADVSPVKHVDRVSIPILLIHGRDDTVVPFGQSSGMADALKAAGKPYEFVVLKAEDHWLSSSETRLQMLETTVKFLESHNPPQ
ncbi:dipeptidyl aminopeptidase/acylaminoacyl peptidase [Rhizomicrobium palustre]|uniref:Dipeptidyl aminopeptidase/acylaminoacyl peptidase n=1 Tax=Rhizomicrobium palustre TaxID=189966 RepID=A0A846MX13_9PROT|nr:S9 family peptidase [Rhizomicrobium palustre]NIK87765.1 dipeptidyl aminopeptidase/acylaminoacyl peptidase [Rhizomicrobium palustre]